MKKKIGLWAVLMLCVLIISPAKVKAECQHQWQEYYAIEEAQCEEKGCIKIRTCVVCGERQEVIESPHEWGEWQLVNRSDCTTNGEESRYCRKCRARQSRSLPKNSHPWGDWECLRRPTAFQTGYYRRACEWCGTEDYKTVAKLSSVKTTSKLQNEVKKSASAFLAAAKKYDVKKINNCFAKRQKSLFIEKKYIASFIRKSNKKYMRYVITSIKMKGKKNATVTVSCRYQDTYDIFWKSFRDSVNYVIKTGKSSSSILDKYQYNRVVKYDKKYKKQFATKNFNINMKKIGKKWKITSFTKSMKDAIHCNYQSAYDDYF